MMTVLRYLKRGKPTVWTYALSVSSLLAVLYSYVERVAR